MVHIATLCQIIREAFPKSPKPNTYRMLTDGNANDDSHWITRNNRDEIIGVKASNRDTSGAWGEELAYKVSELLALQVVTPAAAIETKEIVTCSNTGVAVIEWAPDAVTLENSLFGDIYTEDGSFAISLGYVSFLCWLLHIGDRHDGNAVVSGDRLYCIDNEDVFGGWEGMPFAFLWSGTAFLDNDGKALVIMAFNEAMWRFRQVETELANLVFSYADFLQVNILHWKDYRNVAKNFENRVMQLMK